MANVHIALVGGQTYPVYLGIAESSPDRVILVHSASSLAEAQRIANEFKGTGIPFIYEQCDPVNVMQVLDKTRMMAKIMGDEDHYTINLTSGTKVWSILFHEAFETKPDVRFIYVDQSCNIYDLSDGACRMGAPLDTDRVFRLNDTRTLSYLDFEALDADDLRAVTTLCNLYRVKGNRTVLTELTVAKTNAQKQTFKRNVGTINHKESSISWDRRADSVTICLDNKGNVTEKTLTSPHVFDLVFNAGWFEAEVARLLSLWKHAHEVRMGVEFPFLKGNPKNEIDVIVNTGTRLLFVECKTAIHTLTDLDKFSKAVRNYGGTGCHALFVSFNPLSKEAAEKCRDNGVIAFSFEDTPGTTRSKDRQDVITAALHRLLDERLFTINKK